MSVREDLLAIIEDAVLSGALLGYNEPTATNDIFENYVWTICLDAARRGGARIRYKDVYNNDASVLTFRTSPGAIYSTSQAYTHAVLDFDNCPLLEIHVGIRITGKSGVLHECDVAVLYRDEAELCRSEQVHPRAARVLIAIECKFYASAIQLHLGRGFIGLTRDIYAKERYFVSNAQSANVAKLIRYHQSEWDFGVLPASDEADALRHRFSRTFRNFVASY